MEVEPSSETQTVISKALLSTGRIIHSPGSNTSKQECPGQSVKQKCSPGLFKTGGSDVQQYQGEIQDSKRQSEVKTRAEINGTG